MLCLQVSVQVWIVSDQCHEVAQSLMQSCLSVTHFSAVMIHQVEVQLRHTKQCKDSTNTLQPSCKRHHTYMTQGKSR